ncbi:hypothetical protein SVTN_39580 (plasmid) [Streptomyces vietnamensis]|uniref:Uncharacterized protein n=1 Tax=Streptomyces vietnamensis TaxID=362257 RepID=A0A0B5IPH7_9ACTN|nr:hypothetical protein SVTN_39580 [Streptomyces vietnamensis]
MRPLILTMEIKSMTSCLAVSELAAVAAAVVQTAAAVVQVWWDRRSYRAGTALEPGAVDAEPFPATSRGPVGVRIAVLPPGQVEISVFLPAGGGPGLGPHGPVKENGPW